MAFPTVEFALFFLIVYTINWYLLPLLRDRKIFLLLASYVFYGSLDLRFLPILILSPVLNHFFALFLEKKPGASYKKKLFLVLGIALNLSVLIYFKYANFFFQLNSDLVLPLGISFFTFQGISYLVDVYLSKISAKNYSYLDVMLLIAFFPHLIAGPIVRGEELLPQIQKNPNPLKIPVVSSVGLILFGLFKKTVIANTLGVELVDPVFENPSLHGSLDVVLAIYAYSVQIFCDFSGYSDMAIGLARLLGYEFPKNFDQPYCAQTLSEFWKRWHISLSRWLRDYLYIPLGGSRHGKIVTYKNLFLTMFLGGLWHGGAWTFIIWGTWHGFGLIVEKYFQGLGLFSKTSTNLKKIMSTFLVFHFVTLGWILFRAKDFQKIEEIFLKGFFSGHPSSLTQPYLILFIGIGIGLHFLPNWQGLSEKVLVNKAPVRIPIYAVACIFGVLLALMSFLRGDGVAPFIYFRF
jgi:D-alanyl-lipoteichoic acid acyltransferase DltB (MBOAT superfamily)